MYAAYVIHALPGRVRVKIPCKRGDAGYFARLENELVRCEGVASARSNQRAASVLIAYAGAGGLGGIADFARSKQLFDLQSQHQVPKQQSIKECAAAQMEFLDRLMGTGSRGRIDLPSAYFLLFLVLGLRQMWRGEIMQPAIPLLWRAVEILNKL